MITLLENLDKKELIEIIESLKKENDNLKEKNLLSSTKEVDLFWLYEILV